jgi:hypothetical protein
MYLVHYKHVRGKSSTQAHRHLLGWERQSKEWWKQISLRACYHRLCTHIVYMYTY